MMGIAPPISYRAKGIRSTACLSNSGECGYCRDALPGVVIIRYGNLTPVIRPPIAPPRVRYPAPAKTRSAFADRCL